MAEGAAAVLPMHPATATAMSSPEDRWDVEFARLFCYPRRSSLAISNSKVLKRLPRKKNRRMGTWIVSKSAAVLRIARPGAASVPVLSVTVAGFVVEEHFISNLHFSWPQVSCVSQCPIRGSRAVFLSYRDGSGQIQKFAVRFPAGCDAEKFLNSVKECLHKTADIAPLACDLVCENSSPSQFTASNRLHYRVDEGSSYEKPVATYATEVLGPVATCSPEIPALTYNVEQAGGTLPPLLANNIETIFSDKSTAGENAKGTSLNEGYSLNPPAHGGAVLPDLTTDADVKSQIVKYVTDASFHDMLSKIEKVMDEMGGDLSL